MRIVSKLKKALLTKNVGWYSAFFTFLLGILLINTFHEKYPDEFDNILGGWYTIHGRLPYTGFFTHHGPIPYFIAGIIEILSGRSFVIFRLIYGIALFGFLSYTYILIRKRWGQMKSNFYLVFLTVFGIGSTYYWFHMLLADNIAALMLLPVFIIVFLRTLYNEKFILQDFIIMSFFLFVGILSSLTYIYLVGGFYLYIGFYYMKSTSMKVNIREWCKIIGIFAAPYIAFFLYLFLTKGIADYYYQTVVFNEKYYIYNIPRRADGSLVNPARAAIFLIHEFINNIATLLVQLRDFNFSYPLNITFAFGNLVMFYFLFTKRKFTLALFLFWVLVFANARSNPLTSAVRDYQSAVYIFISVFNIIFVLMSLYQELGDKNIDIGKKVLTGIFFSGLTVYSLFSFIFIVNAFNNNFYPKYMGLAPFIYDRPELAPLLNKITSKNDPIWVGPFEFEELFYMNGTPATKYHILNPGVGISHKISAEQVAEIEKTKPKYIWYNPNFYILGRKPGNYAVVFNAMIARDYIILGEYTQNNKKYESLVPITSHIDFEKNFYLRKDDASVVVQQLLEAHLIKEVELKK